MQYQRHPVAVLVSTSRHMQGTPDEPSWPVSGSQGCFPPPRYPQGITPSDREFETAGFCPGGCADAGRRLPGRPVAQGVLEACNVLSVLEVVKQ